jgi:hypothetical protein
MVTARMNSPLGIIDAVLTAVAALATGTVVLFARSTLKASREANAQLRQSEAALRVVAAATQSSATAAHDTTRVLMSLHESVVREANVARALRDAELARRAVDKYRDLERVRVRVVANSAAHAASPMNHHEYKAVREMFQLALQEIDEPDGKFKTAWNVARGTMDTASGMKALGELEEEVKRRDDARARLENDPDPQ